MLARIDGNSYSARMKASRKRYVWFDQDFVFRWSQRYTDLSKYGVDEGELLNAIGPQVQQRGWYTVPELQQVNRWKLPTERNRKRLRWNRTTAIEAITREALAAPEPGVQSLVMQRLHGVGPAVASALLMVPQPKRHTIIDFRAVAALERLQETDQIGEQLPWPVARVNLPDYGSYLDACHRLAESLSVSLRTLDRALWRGTRTGCPASGDDPVPVRALGRAPRRASL